MSPNIANMLVALREALVALLAVLKRESWQFTSAWESAVSDVDRMVASDVQPDTLARWAMGISHNFGVGMGSLGDVYLGDDFDSIRERVQQLLWNISEAARESPGNPSRWRLYLTRLESALLDARCANDAEEVRQLLSRDEIDPPAITHVLTKLAQQESAKSPAVSAALDELRSEMTRVQAQ